MKVEKQQMFDSTFDNELIEKSMQYFAKIEDIYEGFTNADPGDSDDETEGIIKLKELEHINNSYD